MRAEHLKEWLAVEIQECDSETRNWEWVVNLVHTAFRNETLMIKCTRQTVIILTKGNGN